MKSILIKTEDKDGIDYSVIYNTLKKDTANNAKEACEYIYRQLRNAEPPDEETARSIIEKLFFSEAARQEEVRLLAACQEIYNMAVTAFRTGDIQTARHIEPLQSVIAVMTSTYKENHVERLANGLCTAEQGFIFNDILYSCERIANHSQNIAAITLRVSDINLDSRKYMHDIKLKKTPENEKLYEEFYDKYMN